MTQVVQYLLTLPVHLSSPPVFSEIRVTQSLVRFVCIVFCQLLYVDALHTTISELTTTLFKLKWK